MQISITGRHVDVNDDLRGYAEEKVQRLERFYSRIHEAEVVVSHESEQFTIEVIVRAGHKHTFVATETGPDPLALIDIVTDKVERQLKKQKEKERAHNNRDASQDVSDNV